MAAAKQLRSDINPTTVRAGTKKLHTNMLTEQGRQAVKEGNAAFRAESKARAQAAKEKR